MNLNRRPVIFFPESGGEANGTALRHRRAHERADGLLDAFELALSPQIQGDERALERGELTRKVLVRGESLAQLYEGRNVSMSLEHLVS